LDQRGVRLVSINQPINSHKDSSITKSKKDILLSNILTNNKDHFGEVELKIDLEKISKNLDSQTFIILQLIVDGLNKSEIIEKINISANKFNKCLYKLEKNINLKKLITE